MCAFWVVYGLVHAGFRFSVSHTLSRDDATSSVLVQSLAVGSVRQPPLYEWLLWLSQQAFGTGIASHLALRYALIAALGVAIFGATRAAAKNERIAALASLSLVFTYPLGWDAHEWGTHSLVLSIACVAGLHAAIRFFERPGVGPAVWLGFALALGLYSKFNYPFFFFGLLLAAWSVRELRPRLLDARLVISLAIALSLFIPYFYWRVVQGGLVDMAANHLITVDAPHWQRALHGLSRLATSLPLFLLPWLAFVVVLARGAFVRQPAGAPAPGAVENLALRTMIFAAILMAIGIAITGATTIRARYMHPVLIIAPVYVFTRIARFGLSETHMRRFVVFSVAMALLAFGCRFLVVTDNVITRDSHISVLVPYAELAEALERRGITDGTLVTPYVREAGNLRAFLPDLRVVSTDSGRIEVPPRRPSDARSCVLIWPPGSESLARSLAPVDTLAAERIEIAPRPSRFLAARGETWFLMRLDPKLPICS